MPPSEPPKGTKPKRKPKPPSARDVQRATAQAQPLSSKPVRPKNVARAQRAQRQTARAAPLSPIKLPPANVDKPQGRVQAKPLAAKPLRNTRPGKPVVTKKQQRGLAVAAYDQLPSNAAKRDHVKAAQKRISQGKATEGDKAVVHIHQARQNRKDTVARAQRSFDALNPENTVAKLLDKAKPKETTRQGTGRLATAIIKPKSVAGLVNAVGAASAYGLKYAHLPKVAQNVPKDLAEIAVTTPSSVAKLAETAVTKPKKVPGMLAAPYIELAKHPKKFITEHPASAALMVAPAVRGPGLAAGKVTRLAGKQTLAREAATLPNTALRQARTGSRDAIVRTVQSRADRRAAKAGDTPTITSREINTRVDEAFAAAQKHGDRVHNAIVREATKESKQRPKADRQEFLREMQDQAGKFAGAHKNLRVAEEFGATARVEGGRVVAHPEAKVGRRFDSKEEAQQVADHLNAQNQTIPRGHGGILEGDPAGRKYRNEPVDVKYKVVDGGLGKHAVVPEQVAKRLELHAKVGSTRAIPAVLLRQTRGMMTKAVLPTRPTWLSGQAIEAVARSGVAQAGPSSFLRTARLAKRHPDLYKQLAERAVPGGLGGRVAALETVHRTLNEEFHGESNVARRLTEWGQTPGIKQTRKLYDSYTRFVFDKVNGKFLEGVPQKAMLGRALKQSPLMEQHLLGLSNKAIDEAARGLKNTETQVQLAREVTRSYGKYAAFSPRMRSLIMHWTPFIPWYLNTAKFLLQTLPRDHPMVSAVLADTDAATEEWRKEQGLSLRYRSDKSLPPWMLGGYPIQGGKNLVRIGHYVPAPGTDPTGDVSGLVLPQFAGAYSAIRYGLDWKGDALKHADGTPYNQGEKLLYGVQQMLEATVPLYGQGSQIARSKDRKGDLLKMARPLSTVAIHRDKQAGGAAVSGVDVKGVDVKPIDVR